MLKRVALIIAILVPGMALSQLRPDEITKAPDPDGEIRELLRDALEIQALPNPTAAQLDKEIDYFQQILDLKSDHAVAWDGLTRARAQKEALLKNQSDDAKKKQQASAGAARSEQAFLTGDTEGAQKELDAAQKANPNDPGVIRMAARLKNELIRRQRQRLLMMVTSGVILLGLVIAGWKFLRVPRIPLIEFADGVHERVSLDRDVTRVGAIPGEGDRKNDVVLTDPDGMISRYHCELQKRGKRVFLVDCNSRNGTTVDGRRVAPHRLVPLHDGSKIGVAMTHDLRLVFERKKK